MRAFVVLAMMVFLALTVEGGWWRRKSKEEKPKEPSLPVKISVPWRKRRAAEEHGKYNVTLQLSPCEFKSYDEDLNGVIELDEMKNIFDDEKLSGLFFNEADSNDDGSITEDEFVAFSKYITGCED